MEPLLCSRMRAATIRGRLLFLWWTSRCGYYSRAATIRGAASIRINTVITIKLKDTVIKHHRLSHNDVNVSSRTLEKPPLISFL